MSHSTDPLLIAILFLSGLVSLLLIKAIQCGREIRDLKIRVNESLAQLFAVTTKAAHSEGVIAGGDVARALGVIATAVAVRDNAIAISLIDVAKSAAESKAVTDAAV